MHDSSEEYVFEMIAADGRVIDYLDFYGPYSAGLELAVKRATARGTGRITVTQL